MSAKSLKLFGPPTTKWRPCKIFAKLNRNHLLIANIFKLHEYQTFGSMKIHNIYKIWFANKIFSLLRWNNFFMIFHGIPVGRNCPAPLTILAIKRGLLCNFAKNFKGRHLVGHDGADFQLLLNSKSSKLPLIVFLKIFWKYLFCT